MAIVTEHPLATKSMRAYLALRREIITGAIPSNVALREAEIMERTGFGRTPIREALKRLANEGFVVWTEQRSPFVRDSHPTELVHLTEARIAVEVPAARLAAARMSVGQMQELRLITAGMAQRNAAGDFYELTELDYQFHTQLALSSGNRFLHEAASALNAGALRLWYRASSTLGSVDNAHDIILDALERRDEQAVEDAVRDHILVFQQRQLTTDAKRHGAVAQQEGQVA